MRWGASEHLFCCRWPGLFWLAAIRCWQLQVWVHQSLAKVAGPDRSMPAWPSDKRFLGLVSGNERDGELACLGPHKKTAEWLGDRACQSVQFGPL